MPSLKMKTKSATGCLRERDGLRVCRKSSMITKSPLSQARISQNTEEVETVVDTGRDVSSCDKVYSQDIRGDEANHNEVHNGNSHFPKQESTTGDFATDGCTESTTSTCSSSLETIFSPILEAMNFHWGKGSDNLCVPLLDVENSDDSSRRSSEHQDCNVSDFYISDMIFSGLPIERNLSFDNNVDSMFLPDYKCEESNIFCDLAEDYMVLPLLEDTLETRYDHDGKASGEIISNANDSSLYLAIHQLRSSNQDTDINIYPNSDQADSFDPQIYIRNLPDQLDAISTLPHANILKEKQKTKQITLVLDLDETLVHSTLEFCSNADFTFPVFFNMKEHIVYVKQRPYLQMFLERVAEMFETVVFTASQSIYAKQLLDILDPDGKLISRRAYRESCIFAEGNYMKDLTVLGVDLAKVAIIDNSPQVFRLQVNNGIPIKSWFDDPGDTALISLLPFLETLVDANDVRPIIARKFGNKE
ncbi:CTD small phosphatase 2 [Olea europaea subsp. europaea]|uniref:CTD small phosphatase 2 n=1 Tax=Olea europaea subsp. europaea TaxID=158383 RepID=A0A8S0PJR4_OLEEU|nr:CTD small phosphatase 2 [Olea europaea subsp. europaea]